MPFSEAIDHNIIEWFINRTAFPAATALYAGLSSTAPTKTGGSVTEPSAGAYARVLLEETDFDAAPASSAIANDVQNDFPQATADWLAGANLTHMVFYTAVTAGTFKGSKALTTAKPVLTNDTAKIEVGDLTITIGGTA